MKILRNILITLLVLVVLCYGAYKIAYPYVAPIVFDYIVDTNLDAFMKLEQSLVESLPEETTDETITSESEVPIPEATDEEPVTEETNKPETTTKPKETSAPAKETPKPNTEIQTVKTTMGSFSGAQLTRALKNMSPADKTRIISLCQSAVSTSDILKTGKMFMQDGLTVDQQKYIENYLRDNLSVPAKREILEILQKY